MTKKRKPFVLHEGDFILHADSYDWPKWFRMIKAGSTYEDSTYISIADIPALIKVLRKAEKLAKAESKKRLKKAFNG